MGKEKMQNTSVDDTSIMAMDFTSIEEMDPSLADGFHIIYSREVHYARRNFSFLSFLFLLCINLLFFFVTQVPIEVRTQVGDEDPEQGTLESIHVKMLALGSYMSNTIVFY